MVFVWCLCGVCEVFVRCLCGVCVVFVRCLCGVCVVFVWCLCGVCVVFVRLPVLERPHDVYSPVNTNEGDDQQL